MRYMPFYIIWIQCGPVFHLGMSTEVLEQLKKIVHLYMNEKEKRKLHLCMNHQGLNPLTVELLELCVKCPATVGAPKYIEM